MSDNTVVTENDLTSVVEVTSAGPVGPPGMQPNAPGAVAALVCSLIGLFIFGIILGPIGIAQGNKAMRNINENPGQFKGKGMAQAGIVIGIIDVVGWLIYIIFVFGSM